MSTEVIDTCDECGKKHKRIGATTKRAEGWWKLDAHRQFPNKSGQSSNGIPFDPPYIMSGLLCSTECLVSFVQSKARVEVEV